MAKLGVIVPYRDRYKHLLSFKKSIIKHLNAAGIEFELIVVEQDGGTAFNRGKLLNIGFLTAEKLNCDYVVFHDIDMLPVEVDYSFSSVPLHLATNFVSESKTKRTLFDEYFGGVTLFPVDLFRRINGYSNNYWGWGFEDDDLLYRCKLNGIPLEEKEIKNVGGNTAALKFNGNNAYVKGKNVINVRRPLTIFVSFSPNETVLNYKKDKDIYGVVGIPGYDLLISYSSYKRYNFEIFDNENEVIYISTDIKPHYKTNVAITIDPTKKHIIMYQDGEFVKRLMYKTPLYNYIREPYFYLGCADPLRTDDEKMFNGLINSVAIYDEALEPDEIFDISNNKYFGLTQNFKDYKSAHKLKLYYDAKFIKDYKLIDLSGRGNDGEIVNCEMVGYDIEDSKLIEVPFRRECTFKLLAHAENGYTNNEWREKTTRYNQLKFQNEVSKGHIDTNEEGLNNCYFTEHSRTKVNNQTHIIVGL
jgi:hypothetical protein